MKEIKQFHRDGKKIIHIAEYTADNTLKNMTIFHPDGKTKDYRIDYYPEFKEKTVFHLDGETIDFITKYTLDNVMINRKIFHRDDNNIDLISKLTPDGNITKMTEFRHDGTIKTFEYVSPKLTRTRHRTKDGILLPALDENFELN